MKSQKGNSSAFMEKMLARMSSKTIEKLRNCDCNFTSSDKADVTLQKLRIGRENDRIALDEKEIEARVKLEELEVQNLVQLNETLAKEIENFGKFSKKFTAHDGDRSQIETSIQSYNKMLKSSKIEEYIDVIKMTEIHKENDIKRARIKELEKYTDQFMELPDNLADAREAVRKLEEELKTLRIKSEIKTQQEVAQFNRTASVFSINSIYHKK